MENLPRSYLAALAEFERADEDLQRLASQLASFADNLERYPGETCFVGLEHELRPALDELMPGRRWDAARFPTPYQLQMALRRRLTARAKAHKLYESMTSAQRKGAPIVRR